MYLRVSGPEQAKGWSLDGQYREVRAYCERQGYRVVRRHSEVASGRDKDRRQLRALLGQATAGDFEVVVVWRQDRFCRSVAHFEAMREVLCMAGVKLESSMVGPQADNSSTRLQTRVQAVFSEFEAESIVERCTMGRREQAQAGIWPTAPPPGYLRDPETRGLVPDRHKAPTIRYVFLLAAAGLTTRQVAGIVGWDHTAVVRCIRRDAYLGDLRYTDVHVPNAWPAIVDRETAMEARESLDQRRRNRT